MPLNSLNKNLEGLQKIRVVAIIFLIVSLEVFYYRR